ncbi:putative calcium-dependent cell-adhesion protein [Cichlidogyrus casuarinus]|uniref:Calcium-dependent cell-adhesion protein n=1 Tax=Cichlidogyrus casuarinus TaxID=1844966 RepID=A0ABD2QGA2_9PLAT
MHWVIFATLITVPMHGSGTESLGNFAIVEGLPENSELREIGPYLQNIRSAKLLKHFPNSLNAWTGTFHRIGNGEIANTFRIDQQNGSIFTNRVIDREKLCENKKLESHFNVHKASIYDTDCSVHLEILITFTNNISSSQRKPILERFRIQFSILDINDNAPQWQSDSLWVSFVESASNDESPVPVREQNIQLATDPDFGPNGTISYKLLGPGSSMFRLETPVMSNGEQQFLKLSPVTQLDRECKTSACQGGIFNLTLEATDHGTPERRTQIPLFVEIQDMNDNVPTFHESELSSMEMSLVEGLPVYKVPNGRKILESLEVNQPVIQINATDEDTGENGQVRYDFCPCEHNSLVREYFRIDQRSGLISIKKKLDYDRGPNKIHFKVIAADLAAEPYRKTSTALVEVQIKDVNDERPEIDVILVQQDQLSQPLTHPNLLRASMSENTRKDELLAFIQVSLSCYS